MLLKLRPVSRFSWADRTTERKWNLNLTKITGSRQKPTTSDYQSGHCLHLSVVSQHVCRQSLERPEVRFTLCFKTAPPLRYLLLRKLRGMPRHFLKATRWDLHRQRLKTQSRDIHGNEICCQFAVQKKGLSHHCPCVEQLSFRRTVQALAAGLGIRACRRYEHR